MMVESLNHAPAAHAAVRPGRTADPATTRVTIRAARIADMLQVEPLINSFAAKGLMLFKTREQLVRLFREFVVAVDQHDRLLGCGGLRIFSPQLAEVISLAVSEEAHGLGIGGKLVDRLGEDAAALGIGTVFALTLRDGFFHRLGYRTVPKEMFPLKVWSDCRTCNKINACDEIAVVKEIEISTAEAIRDQLDAFVPRGSDRPLAASS